MCGGRGGKVWGRCQVNVEERLWEGREGVSREVGKCERVWGGVR